MSEVLNDEEFWDYIKNKKWYVVKNDIIDTGWAVATVNKSLSRLNFLKGEIGIADFMIEEAAEHIVELHNGAL